MSREINLHTHTATFQIDMVAAGDRATYRGSFKVNCLLSPLDLISSDALYRKLLGGTNPSYASEYVSNLAYALSQLKYRITEAPAWFKSEDGSLDGSHIDDAILLKVFDESAECEEEYRKGNEQKYQKAKN